MRHRLRHLGKQWKHCALCGRDGTQSKPNQGRIRFQFVTKPRIDFWHKTPQNERKHYRCGQQSQPYNTIEFYFTATSFVADVLERALDQWRTLAPSRPKPTAATIMDRWAIFVLRTGCGMVECGIDDPLHTRHTAATRLDDWFDAPPRPNAPTHWQDARPAFVFTAGSIQDSAHTRLEAAKALAEDQALLATHLGHDGSFTWKLDGHIGL